MQDNSRSQSPLSSSQRGIRQQVIRQELLSCTAHEVFGTKLIELQHQGKKYEFLLNKCTINKLHRTENTATRFG